MNSLKDDPLQAAFERTLGRILKNWSSRFSPPRDGRARLLQLAYHIQQADNLDKQKSENFRNLLIGSRRIEIHKGRRRDNIWNLYDRFELTISRIN